MFAKNLDDLVDALIAAETENAQNIYGEETFDFLCGVLKEELAEAATEFAHLRDAGTWQKHETNLGVMLSITKQAIKELAQVATVIKRCVSALQAEESKANAEIVPEENEANASNSTESAGDTETAETEESDGENGESTEDSEESGSDGSG